MKLKKAAGLLLAVILAAGLFAGCDSASMLGINVKQGDKYSVTSATEQKISMELNGQKLDISSKIDTGYIYDVTGIDKDGNATIKVQYDYIAVDQSSGAGSVSYDSRQPGQDNNPLAQQYKPIIGKGFTITMAKSGKIVAIEGIDKMLDDMLGSIEGVDPSTLQTLKDSLKQSFGDEALKEALGEMSDVFPDKKVNVGDSWTKEQEMNYGFPIKTSTTWILKELKDGKATVEVTSNVATNPGGSPIDLGVMKMNYQVNGTQSGTLKIDKDNGLLQQGSLNQSLTGTADMEIPAVNGQEAQKMSVPVSIEGKTTYETKKLQ